MESYSDQTNRNPFKWMNVYGATCSVFRGFLWKKTTVSILDIYSVAAVPI